METIYLVGIMYDDFGDGGFDVVYITNDLEMAISQLDTMDYEKSEIREYRLNADYRDYEPDTIMEKYCEWNIDTESMTCRNYIMRVVDKQVAECVSDIYKHISKDTIDSVEGLDWRDDKEVIENIYKVVDERIKAHNLGQFEYKVYHKLGLEY